MTTKINATDVNVMTFNADPFLASDEYGEEEISDYAISGKDNLNNKIN
jgi:hypothetical protein